jgi:hypothetical protein
LKISSILSWDLGSKETSLQKIWRRGKLSVVHGTKDNTISQLSRKFSTQQRDVLLLMSILYRPSYGKKLRHANTEMQSSSRSSAKMLNTSSAKTLGDMWYM